MRARVCAPHRAVGAQTGGKARNLAQKKSTTEERKGKANRKSFIEIKFY